MATSQAITVDFERYPKVPQRDPVTHHPIPEPRPENVDRSTYEYVTVPERDIFDKRSQGAAINGVKFEAGQTYFLPADFAATLREILARGQRADIRILQSTPDVKAVTDGAGNANGAVFSPNSPIFGR